ncbi:MAG: hypothetical protein NTZ67_02315 [Gammaproteobacteria bacterium]|nr:hypothetical protein [Gammaproteobacteria bacterium]
MALYVRMLLQVPAILVSTTLHLQKLIWLSILLPPEKLTLAQRSVILSAIGKEKLEKWMPDETERAQFITNNTPARAAANAQGFFKASPGEGSQNTADLPPQPKS